MLLKCSEDLFSSRSQSAKKTRKSFANVSSPGNLSSDSLLRKQDSVFGDMDFTMLEKQMNDNEQETPKKIDVNLRSKIKNSEPASCTTVSGSVNSVALNALPQKSNETKIENKRAFPLASTPNKPISAGSSLTKKIRER